MIMYLTESTSGLPSTSLPVVSFMYHGIGTSGRFSSNTLYPLPSLNAASPRTRYALGSGYTVGGYSMPHASQTRAPSFPRGVNVVIDPHSRHRPAMTPGRRLLGGTSL